MHLLLLEIHKRILCSKVLGLKINLLLLEIHKSVTNVLGLRSIYSFSYLKYKNTYALNVSGSKQIYRCQKYLTTADLNNPDNKGIFFCPFWTVWKKIYLASWKKLEKMNQLLPTILGHIGHIRLNLRRRLLSQKR